MALCYTPIHPSRHVTEMLGCSACRCSCIPSSARFRANPYASKVAKLQHRRSFTSTSIHRSAASPLPLNGKRFKLAVVGSGPAGFYAASRLLGMHGAEKATVDMYEELPVPFGLVRYGVAPDHPEVKNCIHKFEELATDKRFRFFGNVQIGGPASSPSSSSSASASSSSSPSSTSSSSSSSSTAFTSPHPSHQTTQHALSIPLSFLQPHYNAILFTYGASADRSLGPSVRNDDSSTLENVLSARSFVHWYNGHPHSPFHQGTQSMDLSNLYKAAIIGQGNVALDCARILLSGGKEGEAVMRLAKTDIPESVLAELAKSRIDSVDIVGRRGPLQFAGTTKEVRELVTLEPGNIGFHMQQDDLELVNGGLKELKAFEDGGGKMENARMKKRLLGLMQKATATSGSSRPSEGQKQWSLSFCRSPVALLAANGGSDGPIRSVQYELNDLQPASTARLPSNDLVDPSAFVSRGTGETVEVETDLLLKSVGYRSIGLEGLPFDSRKGIVRNNEGRVVEADGTELPGLYVSGWLARGPNGVIATTMYDAFQTAELVAADFAAGSQSEEHLPDLPNLHDAGFGSQRLVSWEDWRAIDEEERKRGRDLGKEREKFTTVESMLGVLG